MTYLIDAWLDRPRPYLRILHRETGAVCAVLREDALDELWDQGDLDITDLSSNAPGVLAETVRNLFLFCYARALRPAGECAEHGALKQHAQPGLLNEPARSLQQSSARMRYLQNVQQLHVKY